MSQELKDEVQALVAAFVILDDRDDMAMHRARLIQVSPQVGLTIEQAQRAIELLARPWKGEI